MVVLTFLHRIMMNNDNIVKLREREGQRVDSGSRLSIIDIDCRLSILISLKLYTKFGCQPPPPPASLIFTMFMACRVRGR